MMRINQKKNSDFVGCRLDLLQDSSRRILKQSFLPCMV